jgi:hypothetical protein
METLNKELSNTQRKILTAANKQPQLPIEEHMTRYKSPAVRRQIAYSLLNSGYVSEDGDYHYITEEGVAALSAKKGKAAKAEKKEKPVKEAKAKKAKGKKVASEEAPDDSEASDTDTSVSDEEATAPDDKAASEGKPVKGRQLLINMLSTDDGATIQEMADATGWQAGAISGTMSKIKKLIAPNNQGITATKQNGGKAVYRIVDLADANSKQAAHDDAHAEAHSDDDDSAQVAERL